MRKYSNKKILLYGGSFDPIHNGHLHIAREAADCLDIDKVVFIPAGQPPHKLEKKLAMPKDRYEMVKRAIEFNPLFDVSDSEVEMDSPSFTVHTVRFFRSQYSNCEFFWLIGADSFSQLDKWYRIDMLVDLCTLVTVGRPGYDFSVGHLTEKLNDEQLDKLQKFIIDVPLTDESSTEIRKLISEGQSVEKMVPAAVAEYIASNGLYVE